MNQPTGLRLGEAAALRMSDADVPARRIRVRVSVSYVRKTGRVEGPTKKRHGARGAGASFPGPAARNRDSRP
jgi:integrase